MRDKLENHFLDEKTPGLSREWVDYEGIFIYEGTNKGTKVVYLRMKVVYERR